LTHFAALGLAEPILQALTAEGYKNPTPIQAKAIPVLLEGQDIVGIAQTGTGKTAAFVLPLLDRIVQEKRNRVPNTCSVIIVTPTRELASQIVGNINTYAKFTKLSVALIVGGVRPGGQIKAMRGGVDIIVATPGRLLDHMGTGTIVLKDTQAIVLDEADQMMDLGFLPGIRKVMNSLPRKRVTALFSATMPREIRRLANDFLNNPVEIAVAAVSQPIERIKQSVQMLTKAEKRTALNTILQDESVKRVVIFTRTKRGADRVAKDLKAAEFSATAIHGDKTQSQREKALKQFRTGNIDILVATDIAARGIDIDDVTHVVNYDLPEVPEAYVHRIGRTARAGRSGVAISFCSPAEHHLLRAIEKLTKSKIDGSPEEKDRPRGNGAEAGHRKPSKPRSQKSRRGRPFRDKNEGQSEGQKRHKPNKPAHASKNGKNHAAQGRRSNRRHNNKPQGATSAA